MAAALKSGVYVNPKAAEGWRRVRLLAEYKRVVCLKPLEPKEYWSPKTELYLKSEEFYRDYVHEPVVRKGN